MVDGCQFEKPLYRHISATAWPILTKFATIIQIGPLQRMDRWKFEFFKTKMAAAAILKNHKNRAISATVWLIFTKFGTLVQNGSVDRSNC